MITRGLCKAGFPLPPSRGFLWSSSGCYSRVASTVTHHVISLASNCTTSSITNEIINSAKRNSEPAIKQMLPWFQVEGLINYALPYPFSLRKANKTTDRFWKGSAVAAAFVVGRGHSTQCLDPPKEGWMKRQETSLSPTILKRQ